MTETKMQTEPIPPVQLAIVGGTGSGGSPLTAGIAVTPDHQPNFAYQIISPLMAIAVRFGNTFCVSLVGSFTTGGLTDKIIPHADIVQLVHSSIMIAICIAGVGALKDSATIFMGLEKKFPLSTGNV